MAGLFEKTEINGMVLRNRFVRSATWEGMADEEGFCTPPLKEIMTGLAEGGVGLIVSSHAFIRTDGQAGPRQLGIYKDELVPALREAVDAVHDKGAKCALQLAHAGYFANAKLTGQTPLAASNVEEFAQSPRREMAAEDIRSFVESFAQAAARAVQAGFDAVQIHAAHGYLLSQFLSPRFNLREDEYGGPVENRARFLLEVLQAIRSEVGPSFPILVKMNSDDGLDGGLTVEDSLKVGAMLREAGIDAIELSGGTVVSGKFSPSREGIKSQDREAYFKDAAKSFKRSLDVPMMLVGGIRSLETAERLIDEGFADYVSLCRPLIREPGLVKRWESGDRRKAACISDNRCFEPARAGVGIYCVVDKENQDRE